MLFTAGLTMPEARFIDSEGKSVRVQLPGTRLQVGAVHYDKDQHKDKLVCICCEAPVHFRVGAQTISGDNLRGPRPHFASNRRAAHAADCTVPLRLDEGRDPTEYDLTLGYRIHINTGQLKEQFDVKARPYARRPDRKIMINDPALAAREPFSVRGAADFLRIMRKDNKERLRKAVIVNGSAQIDWKDFFVRYAYHQEKQKQFVRSEPRFHHLVKQLEKFGSPQLVLMEFDLTKPQPGKRQTLCAQSSRIYIGQDDKKVSHFIVPRLYIEGPKQAEIARILADKDRFMVLGPVRLRTEMDVATGEVCHYLNMVARDPAQVTKADLPRLAGLVKDKPTKTRQLTLEI